MGPSQLAHRASIAAVCALAFLAGSDAIRTSSDHHATSLSSAIVSHHLPNEKGVSRSSSSSSSRSRSSASTTRLHSDLDEILKLASPTSTGGDNAASPPSARTESGKNQSMMRTSVCNRKLLQCHDEIAEKKTELEIRMREKARKSMANGAHSPGENSTCSHRPPDEEATRVQETTTRCEHMLRVAERTTKEAQDREQTLSEAFSQMTARAVIADASAATFQKELVDARRELQITMMQLSYYIKAEASSQQMLDEVKKEAFALKEENAALRVQKHEVRFDLEDAEADKSAAIAQRDAAIAERDAAYRTRDALNHEKNTANLARDAALSEMKAANVEKDAAVSQRDAARAERDAAYRERDSARTDLDAAVLERDAMQVQRDAAHKERDALKAERDKLLAEKDAAISKADAAIAQRDALRAEKYALITQTDKLRNERDALRMERNGAAAAKSDVFGAKRGSPKSAKGTLSSDNARSDNSKSPKTETVQLKSYKHTASQTKKDLIASPDDAFTPLYNTQKTTKSARSAAEETQREATANKAKNASAPKAEKQHTKAAGKDVHGDADMNKQKLNKTKDSGKKADKPKILDLASLLVLMRPLKDTWKREGLSKPTMTIINQKTTAENSSSNKRRSLPPLREERAHGVNATPMTDSDEAAKQHADWDQDNAVIDALTELYVPHKVKAREQESEGSHLDNDEFSEGARRNVPRVKDNTSVRKDERFDNAGSKHKIGQIPRVWDMNKSKWNDSSRLRALSIKKSVDMGSPEHLEEDLALQVDMEQEEDDLAATLGAYKSSKKASNAAKSNNLTKENVARSAADSYRQRHTEQAHVDPLLTRDGHCKAHERANKDHDEKVDNWSGLLVLYPCVILGCILLILYDVYYGEGRACDFATAWMEDCASHSVQSPFEYPCDDVEEDYDALTDEEEDAAEHTQARCGGKSVKVVRITKPEIPPEAFHAVGQAMARSISSISSSQVSDSLANSMATSMTASCASRPSRGGWFSGTSSNTHIARGPGSCEEDDLSLPDGGCWRLAASVDDDFEDDNSSDSDSERRQDTPTPATPASFSSANVHNSPAACARDETATSNNKGRASSNSSVRGVRKWFSGSGEDATSRPESQNPQPSDQYSQRGRASSSVSMNSCDFVRVGGEWTPRESLDDSALASTPEHRISQGWLAVGNALQSSSISDTEI